MPLSPDDPDFVNALARGLSVVTSFGQQAESQTLSEIAVKTSLSRGTARRLLLTLEALGYVRSDGKSFRLAPKTLNLGYAYLSSLPLWKAAQPIMKDLVETLNESCALGVLDKYFQNAKLEKITRYTPTSEVAIRRALAGVAKDGFALSDQQLQLGLLSIAVPVPVRSGRPEVAMNVSAEDHRVTKRELIRRFLPILRRAADQLAHAL